MFVKPSYVRILRLILSGFRCVFESIFFPVAILLCIFSRLKKKKIQIGLGPEPLINNIHHKDALTKHGFSAETFVHSVYYITSNFDKRFDLLFRGPLKIFKCYFIFIYTVFRYQCIYIYFNGGPLGFSQILAPVEPYLYRLAGIKTLVMPYGSDIQDFTIAPNLAYKHFACQYDPKIKTKLKKVRHQIMRWTRHADHIISGCEWVYYTPFWNTLMLAHFSINTKSYLPTYQFSAPKTPLRVLHAPNHRDLKGTSFFQKAVKELKEEGHQIELIILERVPQSEIKSMIEKVDVVADQLIVGWYAMFAIEAMALGKPVICHLRNDLVDLFSKTGLIPESGLPIINASTATLKATLKGLHLNRKDLPEIGRRSRKFVEEHHSIESVGKVFGSINQSLGLKPALEESYGAAT